MPAPSEKTSVRHCFLDETGDPTFFGKGRKLILGQEGVSLTFGMGLVHFEEPLEPIRERIRALQTQVETDPLYASIPSVVKRAKSSGFFFHACKDTPDVRAVLLPLIRSLQCSAEIVIARKDPLSFADQHHSAEDEFYAHLLSHSIKGRLHESGKLVLNVAERGSSTREKTLTRALDAATALAGASHGPDNLHTQVAFNIQNPRTEPLLTIADYLSWAVQRVFEKGEMRFYDYLSAKIRSVTDLSYRDGVFCPETYDQASRLSIANKIGPPVT
jgi:hypothetical protein